MGNGWEINWGVEIKMVESNWWNGQFGSDTVEADIRSHCRNNIRFEEQIAEFLLTLKMKPPISVSLDEPFLKQWKYSLVRIKNRSFHLWVNQTDMLTVSLTSHV